MSGQGGLVMTFQRTTFIERAVLPGSRPRARVVSDRILYMIRRLRLPALCILVGTALLSVSTGLFAQEDSGMICVAPYPKPVGSGDACLSGAQGFSCASGNVTLKVDSRKPVPWPEETSMSLAELALDRRHRIVLLCDGKPKESFKFRFSELRKNKACLSVNELYGWVQLWDLDKHAPWCQCRDKVTSRP